MKNLLIVPLLFLTLLAGCQTTKPVTRDDFDNMILQHQTTIRVGAQLTTAFSLLAVKEADREAVATEIYQYASAINTFVNDQNGDMDAVKKSIDDLLNIKDHPNTQIAATALLGALTLVETEINAYFKNADADTSKAAQKAFMLAVTQGVMDATATPAKIPLKAKKVLTISEFRK